MENIKVIQGFVHKFGDNINTDLISPAQYMELDSKGISEHAMEGADPDFPRKMKPGDIVVAGKNFGSGSSRETAPAALKGIGVSVVIAEFFARIFYRNCINIGLPVMMLDSTSEISDGDELKIELDKGLINDLTTGKTYESKPLPENIMKIISHGGLLGDLEYRLHRNEL